MEVNLLDRMLTDYQDRKVPVTIVLQNKVRVSGRIGSFDSYVIMLENQKHEIIYRHAISSLSQAVAVEQAKPAQRRPDQPRPAQRPPKSAAAPAARPRPVQQPPRPAAQADSPINNSMKEGLLRWMQGQKASK